MLYLVGTCNSIACCSIEAQAPGSVLAIPRPSKKSLSRASAVFWTSKQRHARGAQCTVQYANHY